MNFTPRWASTGFWCLNFRLVGNRNSYKSICGLFLVAQQLNVCVFVCLCVCVCVAVWVWVFVCVGVCVGVCLYLCISVAVFVCCLWELKSQSGTQVEKSHGHMIFWTLPYHSKRKHSIKTSLYSCLCLDTPFFTNWVSMIVCVLLSVCVYLCMCLCVWLCVYLSSCLCLSVFVSVFSLFLYIWI